MMAWLLLAYLILLAIGECLGAINQGKTPFYILLCISAFVWPFWLYFSSGMF
jgi:hypothetical protein